MADNLNGIWERFFTERVKPLAQRFPGLYRAVVVETNDPLNMRRIQFKCPDLHDYNLKDEECPWAVPAPAMGGHGHGYFPNVVRGDWVWISFERQHPYGPVWIGAAQPTRRRFYPLPSVHRNTPVPVNDEGRAQIAPEDFNPDYLPKDGRPMSNGLSDRYGNLDLMSAVGFFPEEHRRAPSGAGVPEVNNPDVKCMVRLTKYGNMMLLGDQGYHWRKDTQKRGEEKLGEFTGEFTPDLEFEIKRWKYLNKLINENAPTGADQRRAQLLTRYGHKIEARDVGWAQQGPIPSQSREGEYGAPRTLSKERRNDYRWIKLRTKGGMLYQAYDKGFDPAHDRFVKRKLLDEVGALTEREDKHWADKDGRWIRIATRYGFKFVLDDRGSDSVDADHRELPRGNGLLIKGRMSPTSGLKRKKGNPRGYFIEFNENDELNHMTLGSPLGQVLEINDRYEYTMFCTRLGSGYSRKFRGLEENEFLLQPTMHPDRDPEHKSHHLKLDLENEYIRLKTRAGQGPSPDTTVNPPGVDKGEEHQGLEAHDGSQGFGPWVEVVDCQGRGFWLSKNLSMGIWRGRRGSQLFQWLDDANQAMVLFNGDTAGKVQIYGGNDIEVMGARNVTVHARGVLRLKGSQQVELHGGTTMFTITSGSIQTNAPIVPGGVPVDDLRKPNVPAVVEPGDRAAGYNGPVEACPVKEVEHPVE